MPAASRTIEAVGANVAESLINELLPTSVSTPGSTPAPNSSSSRDLPMPGSPTTVKSIGVPVACTRANDCRSSASSSARPTNGIVRRADRVVRPCTGNAASSVSNPFAGTVRASAKDTDVSVSARASSPTSTSPGAAAACRRAAALTTGPVIRSCDEGPIPVAASPDSTPTWTSSGRSSPSSWLSRRSLPRIASPARTARTASSSCVWGRPKTAMTASPMNFSGWPRSA